MKRLLHFRQFLPLVLLIVWLGLVYFLYRPNIFSIRFGDEEDNFLLGKLLLNGEKIYSQLFAHHQPLGYVLSATVQFVTHPDNLVSLVNRHREFLWLWSGFWTGLAVVIFGWPALIFSLAYEFPKRFLFGDEFLSESLAAYPLIFLLLFCLEGQRLNTKGKAILIGLAWGIVALLLMPLWPALAFLMVAIFVLLFKNKKIREFLPYIFSGGFAIVLVVLPFIDLDKYLYDFFYINSAYYIPFATSPGEGTSLMGFLAPITAFIAPGANNEMLWVIRIFSAVLGVNLIYLLYKRRLWQVIFIFVSLGLINLRYTAPGKVFYNGFHTLPWFACLTLVISYLSWKQWKVIMVVIVATSFFLPKSEVLRRSNPARDFHVNYSQSFDVAQAINAIGNPSDTIFAAPGDWLVYWQSRPKHASFMLNYYGWMPRVPALKNEVETMFDTRLPTFFYCNEDCRTMGLEPRLNSYTELFRDGIQTGLFIQPKSLESLSSDQKQKLKFFRFSYQTPPTQRN